MKGQKKGRRTEMLLESLQMTGLAEAAPVQVVSLHGEGTFSGYKVCGNFTGPEEAAGEKVVYQGHSVTLQPGRCSKQMMRPPGQPYVHQAPRFFHTKPHKEKVHWDGRIWCP